MELNFKIQNDKLIAGSVLEGNSGNVGTYICKFDVLDNRDYLWFCVFKKDNTAYQQVIEDGRCIIPKEVLEIQGNIEIGCYGASDGLRISTNWLEFSVKDGAYSDATAPQEPTPDVWEVLVMNTLPYIGETGNWYVYDKEKKEYVDSGVSATKQDKPKWELISRGELTEEVSLLAIDGFSCSRVILKLSVKGSPTNESYTNDGLLFRTNVNSEQAGGSNTALTRIFRANNISINVNILLEMQNNFITGHLFGVGGVISEYLNQYGYDSITGVYAQPRAAGIVFGAGTTYELWGVKE